jgi:hypothetical protein
MIKKLIAAIALFCTCQLVMAAYYQMRLDGRYVPAVPRKDDLDVFIGRNVTYKFYRAEKIEFRNEQTQIFLKCDFLLRSLATKCISQEEAKFTLNDEMVVRYWRVPTVGKVAMDIFDKTKNISILSYDQQSEVAAIQRPTVRNGFRGGPVIVSFIIGSIFFLCLLPVLIMGMSQRKEE